MYPIHELSDIEVAFPAQVSHLMPPRDAIPQEFKDGNTKWNELFNQWFFVGLKGATFKPKEGVDQQKALRHIRAVMRSFQPKHEHKEEAVAFLLSEWFDDVIYDQAIASASARS
jgi:hypothetical protein